ncbi:MAG: DMT family transporter [Gammaproteobacteria bacterium]|jgi:drug/metabolite transporter (DMT)-like permease
MFSSPAFIRAAPALFVFLWSTGYVGARFGLPYADPLTFTSVRFAIVIVLLALLIVGQGRTLPRQPLMWLHLAISGMLIHACFVGGAYYAIDAGVEISIAALIAGAQPLLTAFVAVTLLGESLRRMQWLGFAIGFAGLGLVVMKTIALGALPWAGLAGCFVALTGITLGTLYQKHFVVGIDLMAGSAVQFGAALLPCLLWAFAFEERHIEWNATVVATLAWLCITMSIGAISILLVLIRNGAAARVSSLFYLVPPVTALQGYVLFGERLTPVQIAGILLAASGVALINMTGTARPEGRA